MKLSYDPRYNVAYLAFRDDEVEVETVAIGDLVNVDIAPDGSVVGIELLDANRQLQLADGGRLLVVNEADGTSAEVPIPA